MSGHKNRVHSLAQLSEAKAWRKANQFWSKTGSRKGVSLAVYRWMKVFSLEKAILENAKAVAMLQQAKREDAKIDATLERQSIGAAVKEAWFPLVQS